MNEPDNTAIRTALWRALHAFIDQPPLILDDRIGYQLINPEEGWQERPDMKYTPRLRASMLARARFVEELVLEHVSNGINQYVLLGAGLDSFAQRYPDISSTIDIFEIDQPPTLAWKEEKLIANGYRLPEKLHFVPVDFEAGSWLDALIRKGFDLLKPAFVSCTGVTLYLTREAITETLTSLARLAPGSCIAMAFYLPFEQLEQEDQPMQAMALKGAAASGTPFISFFSTEEIEQLAIGLGFKEVGIVSKKELEDRYFLERKDGLRPASGEFFLVAKT